MLSEKFAQDHYEEMISQGMHALIVKHAARVTVHPLTREGHAAVHEMAIDSGVPEESLRSLGMKRDGHYRSALPLRNEPGQIAQVLIEDYGLPDGSIGFISTDPDDITQPAKRSFPQACADSRDGAWIASFAQFRQLFARRA